MTTASQSGPIPRIVYTALNVLTALVSRTCRGQSLNPSSVVPAQPSDLEAEAELDSRITLSWRWPVPDPIVSFELHWWEASNPSDKVNLLSPLPPHCVSGGHMVAIPPVGVCYHVFHPLALLPPLNQNLSESTRPDRVTSYDFIVALLLFYFTLFLLSSRFTFI